MKKKLELPPPRIPVIKKRQESFIEDIQCRFSWELETRLLVFDEESKAKYYKIRKFVEKYANNSCYWEGLIPNVLYGEFNFDNNAIAITHHVIEVEDPAEATAFYELIINHYPQNHRPYGGLKYVSDKEFEKEAFRFPAPYYATGFQKIMKTQYDVEMEMVYNVMPGFSTPIPDITSIQSKLKQIMVLKGKQYVVDLLHKFKCSSLIDVKGEFLYHVDAAADFELREIAES